MKKKFLLGLMCFILLIGLTTGCGSKSKEEVKENKEQSTKTTSKAKDDSKVFDYINKIEVDATLEDVNKIIGFDGKADSNGNGWEKYVWEISDDTNVTVTFYSSSSKCDVKIDFDDELIQNKKVDFSKYDEVSSALKKGETVTYEQIKEKFGGVEGTLVEKSSISNKYRWVNSNGGYLNASFSTSSGKCTMVIGRI